MPPWQFLLQMSRCEFQASVGPDTPHRLAQPSDLPGFRRGTGFRLNRTVTRAKMPVLAVFRPESSATFRDKALQNHPVTDAWK